MRTKPIPSMLRGAIAGALGTLAMDLLWYSRHRRDGGDEGFVDWEFSAGASGWDGAGAPAQFGKRVCEAVGIELPESAAGLTNDVVHWALGVQWGVLYGLVSRSTSVNPLRGVVLGTVAWSTAYVVLPLAKVYKPIWEYDAKTLASDHRAHLLFGTTTAVSFGALGRLRG